MITKKLLYWHDISGFENANYRKLNANVYVYEFTNAELANVSNKKPVGFNDFDPRFSPNDAEVIFMNTSNDGISQKNIFKVELSEVNTVNSRNLLFSNSEMPDWE